jgi:ribosomal protein S26
MERGKEATQVARVLLIKIYAQCDGGGGGWLTCVGCQCHLGVPVIRCGEWRKLTNTKNKLLIPEEISVNNVCHKLTTSAFKQLMVSCLKVIIYAAFAFCKQKYFYSKLCHVLKCKCFTEILAVKWSLNAQSQDAGFRPNRAGKECSVT